MSNHPNRKMRGILNTYTLYDSVGATAVCVYATAELDVFGRPRPNRVAKAEVAIVHGDRRVPVPAWLHPKFDEVATPAAARKWLSRPYRGYDSVAHWAERHLRERGHLPTSQSNDSGTTGSA